jgi:hypothetical protein
VCQHVGAECSLASVAWPICLAAPRAPRRAMRQTDFCLLTFFVPVPAPRRFSMRHALARLRDRGHRLLHISAIRFGGTHVCRGVTAVGVVFPSRCVRSVPLASLSLLSRESCRSRDVRTHESCRDHPQPDRVNDASWTDSPRCLPSSKNLCPATPFRASGSGLHRGRGLATATPDLDTFSPPRILADSRGPGPRPRAPLPTGDTLLWASVSLADFCNRKTTREHTLRAFNPHTRVGLSPRYSPAPTDAGCVGPRYVAASGACEPRSAHAGLRTTCSTCVDEADRGPRRSSKGEPRALGRCRACPSRCASGTRVAGSIGDEAWRTPPLVVPA